MDRVVLCVCVSLWSREGFGKMSAVGEESGLE